MLDPKWFNNEHVIKRFVCHLTFCSCFIGYGCPGACFRMQIIQGYPKGIKEKYINVETLPLSR